MIRQKLKVVGRGLFIILMAVVVVVGDPIFVLAAPIEGDTQNKGDSFYYTQNGIIFYEGGQLYCSSGTTISGGAGGMLQKQNSLDKEWVPIILNAAKKSDADPIAMASLLFWENRGFPKIDQKWGGSDSIGRGPWQIVKGTWPPSAGPYATGVVDPVISTGVAADLVESWGGQAGIPIGSIDQDFGKGKNIPSMATVAKNYNAGRYTWRSPATAGYKEGGRTWMQHNSGAWFGQKQTIIDEYIMAMTYAYYLMGTGQQLPAKGQLNNDEFVKKAVQNAANIKNFKIDDGANIANECTEEVTDAVGGGNGDIVKTAEALAWPGRERDNQDRKSAAKPLYQTVMPKIQGRGTANSVISGNTAWSDCGVFVATTLRYSGADKKYALRGTGVQLSYLKRNRDKYNIYTNFRNTSQLQPGDIFIIDGHTFLHTHQKPYQGSDNKKYNGYSASWGDRVPMANNTYFSDYRGRYTVARLKAPTNPAPAAAGGQ